MRRFALNNLGAFGALCLAVLPACTSTTTVIPTSPPTTEAPASAPSMLGAAPAAASAPVTTSYEPSLPEVVPVKPAAAVAPTPMRARPISGGTLRVLADGRTAVASDADRDLVYVVDLMSGKVTTTVALQDGDEPGRIVEDADGHVHVALRGGGAIATIDPKLPASQALLARRSLCAAPRGLAYDKATNQLHLACAGGELVSIDATPTVTASTRSLSLDRDLRDVVVSTNGRLMVSTFRMAEVFTVEGDGTVSKRQSVTRDPQGRASGVAWRMLGRPDGSCMMLHELSQQQQSLGTFPGAYGIQKSNCGGLVTSTVTVVAPDGDSASPAAAFSGALVAADVAISPGGTQMAVVSIANGDASEQVQFFDVTEDGHPVFDGSSCWPQGSVPALVDATDDTGADGLATPAGYLPPNGQIVAVAYDPRGNVIVQSREPATLQILTQRRDAIVLSQDSRFDTGHQLFHSATGGQIACVSCHPEGGEDGRVWQFQNLGARRTQSLRGGIMDTAPFHWSGDELNMTSLMKDVFQGRMAGGAVDAQRVTALGAWIDQIPTVPVSHRADDATVARGAALFTSAGCVACHAGPDFTGGMTIDVGTGGAFQVPQLHGLGLRAPYMHNGCAATLRDRFKDGCGGDVKHSVGATLSAFCGKSMT